MSERRLTGYRWVETRHGDTLQRIALREFGDAERWAELAHLNELQPPYITDDPALAGEHVLLSGQVIMVPAATPSATQETDPERVFGRDCVLHRGRFVVENGDFKLVSGISNLSQAIRHRVVTMPGDLIFHGGYGCRLRLLLGRTSRASAALLAAQYVQSAAEEDSRVSQVSRVDAVADGDTITVTAEVIPVSGDPVTIQVPVEIV